MARRGCGLDLILAHGKRYKVGAAFPSSSGGSGAQQAWLSSGPRAGIVGLRHAAVRTFCASSPFLPGPTPLAAQRAEVSADVGISPSRTSQRTSLGMSK
jgi:hypothetical protein